MSSTLSVTDELVHVAQNQQLTAALEGATTEQRDAFFAAVAALTPDVEFDEPFARLREVIIEASATIALVKAMLKRTGRGSHKATQVDDILLNKLWDASGDTMAPTRETMLGRLCGLQAVAVLRGVNLRDEGVGIDRVMWELAIILGAIYRGNSEGGISLKHNVELCLDPLVIELAAVHADVLTRVKLLPKTLETIAA